MYVLDFDYMSAELHGFVLFLLVVQELNSGVVKDSRIIWPDVIDYFQANP